MELLADGLVSLGHRVTVACMTPEQPESPLRRCGYEVRRLPFRTTPWGPVPRTFLLPSTDIVHFHGFSRPLFFRVTRLARRRRSPVVLTPHGSFHHYSNRDVFGVRRPKRWFDQLVAPRLLGHCSGIVLLTAEEQAELCERYPALSVPTTVIGNALPRLPEGIVTDGSAPREGRLLVLARLNHDKRIPDLLAALRRDPSLPACDIAGPPGNATDQILAAIAGLPPGRARWCGPLHGLAKYRALASAGALVLPSAHEMQSMAALEAIALGTPLVVSSGASSGLSREHYVQFETGDVDGLIRSLHLALSRPGGSAGAPGASAPYCLDSTELATRTLQVYESALASARPADGPAHR